MNHRHLAALVFLVALSSIATAAQRPRTQRVSVASDGSQANGSSVAGVLSRDGTHVAFLSQATNLVVGDTNAQQDVFVHDIVFGITTRESVDSSGAQAHAASNSTVLGISADGRFVAFCSSASNLVIGDTNGIDDVFLRDRLSGTTIRVSVGSAGQEGNRDSADPSVSDDGRYVAFHSYASNFVTPDTNGTADAFVRDVVAGTTRLVGVNSLGFQASHGSFHAVLSGNGRFVAFESNSTNMVPAGVFPGQVFVRDQFVGPTSIGSVNGIDVPGDGLSFAPFLSHDGGLLTFSSIATNLVAGDTLGEQDGFLRDRVHGNTFRITLGYGGTEANGSSFVTSITDDARYAMFAGFATNVLPFDDNGGLQDCWLFDLATADNISAGADTNGQAVVASALGLSADGQVALFAGLVDDVVPGDNNGFPDLFVRTTLSEAAKYFCTAKVNSLGCTPQIRSFGNSSASASSGFQISATSVRNRRPGMLMYGLSGRAALPFAGGTLCIAVVHRGVVAVSSGGSAAPVNDCTGSYSLDMNAFAHGLLGGQPLPGLLAPGTTVQCQWWSRDPGFAAPNAIGLTGGIEYTVEV